MKKNIKALLKEGNCFMSVAYLRDNMPDDVLDVPEDSACGEAIKSLMHHAQIFINLSQDHTSSNNDIYDRVIAQSITILRS